MPSLESTIDNSNLILDGIDVVFWFLTQLVGKSILISEILSIVDPQTLLLNILSPFLFYSFIIHTWSPLFIHYLQSTSSNGNLITNFSDVAVWSLIVLVGDSILI